MQPVNKQIGSYYPHRLIVAILFFFILFYSSVSGQEGSNIRFDRLTIDDGLSQNTIFAILQDQQGFMWFGTQDAHIGF